MIKNQTTVLVCIRVDGSPL